MATKKTTTKKKVSTVSKAKAAVMRAFKKGKVESGRWFVEECDENGVTAAYPACPLATYGVASGVKPQIEDHDGYKIIDDDNYVAALSKEFGVSEEDIDALIDAWDEADNIDAEEINPLLAVNLNGMSIKEFALSNMIDMFESKMKRKSK